MEFFGWLNISQTFLELFQQVTESITAEEYAALEYRNTLICLAVALGLFLLSVVMGGIGLRTMAKRAGMKPSALAFIPFANTYYAGKLAGEASFFGQRMKRAGLYAMLAEIFYCVLEIFSIILDFALMKGQYLALQKYANTEFYYWYVERSLIPADKQWLYSASYLTEIVSYFLWIFVLVFVCVLFIAFFRKYYARSPILMTMLSVVFPFRGFVLFAVRNNTPVDYNAYMRRRAEEYARRTQPYGGYPGNYGAPPSGTGQNPNPSSGDPQNDPFSEFGTPSEDDPFEDLK